MRLFARAQLRRALSVDVFRPLDAHATQAVVSAVLGFAQHASRLHAAAEAAHSGELPPRAAFSAGGSGREAGLTGSGGHVDDRATFSPLRGAHAAYARQSGSSPSLGSLLHAQQHVGSPLAPHAAALRGAGVQPALVAATPAQAKRPPGLQLQALHASPVTPLDAAALRGSPPQPRHTPSPMHGYTLAGLSGANAAAFFGPGGPGGALLDPATSPRSVGGVRARTPASAFGGGPSAAALAPAPAAPAPPFWPADAPRDVGRCPSEYGGWPGSAPEEEATFIAALKRFWASRAAAASAAAAAAAAASGGPSGGASAQCSSPPRVPVVGKSPLDLAALYREVCCRGGASAVTAAHAWRAVAAALRLPASLTSASSTLRCHYDACLADYEAAHFSAQRARDAGVLLPGAREREREDGDEDDACTESGLSARCGGSASASVGGTATSAGGLARQAQQAQLPGSGSSGRFTDAEDQLILRLRLTTGGNKWKVIAEHLPGRSHASIKKHWHTTLKHKHEAIAAAAGFGEPPQQPAPAAAAHALSAQLGVTALSGSPGGQLRHPVAQRLAPLDAAAATHMALLSNHQSYLAAVAQQQQQLALAHFVASAGAGGAADGEHGHGNGAFYEGGMPGPMQSPGAGGYAGIPLIPMPPGGVFMPSGPQPPRGSGRFGVPFMQQGDAAAHAALLGQQAQAQAQAQFMYPGGHAAALAAMGAAQQGYGGPGYLSPGGSQH